jgi:hypothetical protein
MIKRIMKLLGYKVFTKAEYEQLTNAIAKCGVYYRSHVSDDNEYHHGTRTVTVPLTELSNICLVENCVWEDVKKKLTKAN